MKQDEAERRSYAADRMAMAVSRTVQASTEQEKTISRKWFLAWAKIAKLNSDHPHIHFDRFKKVGDEFESAIKGDGK